MPDRIRQSRAAGPAAAPHWAVNLPLAGADLRSSRGIVEALPDLGFDEVWTGEGGGTDAFTALAAAAAWQPRLRVGTGVVPVYTRGPGVLAQTAASLAALAEGGVALGIGASVPAHVTALNGIPLEHPLARVRDTTRFLRRAVRGEMVDEKYDSFAVSGFRLGYSPLRPPRVLVGALRPGMLRVAYQDGDGAVVNLLTADDLPTVLDAAGGPPPGKETVVKLFVCPTSDAEYARRAGRGFLGWILNQKPYHAFHTWLGRGDQLTESQTRYQAGDPYGAARALPEALVDELWVHGEPEECAEKIARYVRPGVTTVLLHLSPTPELAARPQELARTLMVLRGAAAH
jgi:probable F420-dependent oxidoreductase